MIGEQEAICVRITAGADDDNLKTLSAFLSLSRSGKALVSNECRASNGARSLLVHVRKIDGELACVAIALGDGVTRRDIVKSMRKAGVPVESVNGVTVEATPITIH